MVRAGVSTSGAAARDRRADAGQFLLTPPARTGDPSGRTLASPAPAGGYHRGSRRCAPPASLVRGVALLKQLILVHEALLEPTAVA